MKDLLSSRIHAVSSIDKADQFVLNRATLKKFVKSQLELADTLPDLERQLFISTCKRIQSELKNMPPELVIELD